MHRRTPQPRAGDAELLALLPRSPHRPHTSAGRVPFDFTPLRKRIRAGTAPVRPETASDYSSSSTSGSESEYSSSSGEDEEDSLGGLMEIIWANDRTERDIHSAEQRSNRKGFNWKSRLTERPWSSAGVSAQHFQDLQRKAFIPERTGTAGAPRASLFLGASLDEFQPPRVQHARRGTLLMSSEDAPAPEEQSRLKSQRATVRIMAALESYRHNPSKMRALEERVQHFRKARASRLSRGLNHVKQNKAAVDAGYFSPDRQQLRRARAAEDRARREAGAKSAAKNLFRSTLARRMMIMDGHARTPERLLAARRATWAKAICIALRTRHMVSRFHAIKRERTEFRLKHRSAALIQAEWRRLTHTRIMMRASQGRKKIRKFVRVVVMSMRLKRANPRRTAADTLVKFLTDYGDKANLLRKIVGQFVQRVVSAQRIYRAFRRCRTARLVALSHYFDSIEVENASSIGIESVQLSKYTAEPLPSARRLRSSTFLTQMSFQKYATPRRKLRAANSFNSRGSFRSVGSVRTIRTHGSMRGLSFRGTPRTAKNASFRGRQAALQQLGGSTISVDSEESVEDAPSLPSSGSRSTILSATASTRGLLAKPSYKAAATPRLYNNRSVRSHAVPVSHRIRKLQKRMERFGRRQGMHISKQAKLDILKGFLREARLNYIKHDLPKHQMRHVEKQLNVLKVGVDEAAQLVKASDKRNKHLVEKRFLNATKARTPCPTFLMWKWIDKKELAKRKQEAFKNTAAQSQRNKRWRAAASARQDTLREENSASDSDTSRDSPQRQYMQHRPRALQLTGSRNDSSAARPRPVRPGSPRASSPRSSSPRARVVRGAVKKRAPEHKPTAVTTMLKVSPRLIDGQVESDSDSDSEEEGARRGEVASDAHWTPSSKAAAVALLTSESGRDVRKAAPAHRRRPSTMPVSPRSGHAVIGQGFAKVVAAAVTSSMYLTGGATGDKTQ